MSEAQARHKRDLSGMESDDMADAFWPLFLGAASDV